MLTMIDCQMSESREIWQRSFSEGRVAAKCSAKKQQRERKIDETAIFYEFILKAQHIDLLQNAHFYPSFDSQPAKVMILKVMEILKSRVKMYAKFHIYARIWISTLRREKRDNCESWACFMSFGGNLQKLWQCVILLKT